MMFDPRHETRELGLFLLYDTQRESFIRAEVYNLRRNHEFSSYPVYWAGHIRNEESLNYLKSIVDSPAPESEPPCRTSDFRDRVARRCARRCDADGDDSPAHRRADALPRDLLARQHARDSREEHSLH